MTGFVKDPDAKLDYAWDWSPWLADGEVITDYELTVADGLTLESSDEDAGIVTAWISGGTAGAPKYAVACLVTTNQGRINERTIRITVRER